MRRADRLFMIVQHLRGGRLVTARALGEKLEVSERTIYRDMADLQASGVPIDGEAGVGYILRSGFDLPPLMFNRDEIVALVAGARMVRAWGGLAMARAAEEALVKIEAVLPESERPRIGQIQIHAPEMNMTPADRALVDRFERASDGRCKVLIRYADAGGAATERVIRPLALWFWGKVWTLIAWCEMRDDFRMFRIDRISEARETGDTFSHEAGKRLADLYAIMERDRSCSAHE